MIKCDFLVIGTGIAGLTFAHKAAKEGSVVIVTKKEESDANTNYAQGGIASVFSPTDSFDLHIEDTMKAGDGLCHRDVVETVVKEGPILVKELIDWGVKFTTTVSGNGKEVFDLGMEGGHSRRRIVHSKDLTGKTIENALLEAVKSDKGVRLFENHTAFDLIPDKPKNPKTCVGAYIFENDTGEILRIYSHITFVATGGGGQLYLHTTNPSIATGDGIAMAFRIGAPIANMEFIQFHPTSLYEKETSQRAFLISESVRGEGAVLKTLNGNTFMEKYHPMKSLAPRDIVARAIDSELKKSGDKYVMLDIRPIGLDKFKVRFPNIYDTLCKKGVFPGSELIPVVPAAHYLCGGIVSDMDGRTSLVGLYTAGEASFTGLHGANRLASNSLLEALVFSERAFRSAKVDLRKLNFASAELSSLEKNGKKRIDKRIIYHNRDVLKRIMSDYVGIVRKEGRLIEALKRIRIIKEEVNYIFKNSEISSEVIELRNMILVAEIITFSALKRKESRGLHYILDYPEKDDRIWKKDTVLTSSNLK